MFAPGCGCCDVSGSSGLSGSSGSGPGSGGSGSGSGSSGSGSSGSGTTDEEIGTIDCESNAGELMKTRLNVVATVCAIETPLPDLVYQDIGNGTFAWLWASNYAPPIIEIEEIIGCVGSNKETHTLCFQSIFLYCGGLEGVWPALGVGMYRFDGLFSAKETTVYEVIDTSPFHIRYTLEDTSDITGAGCCGDYSPIIIDIYE